MPKERNFLVQAPKGLRDILPRQQKYWKHLRMVAEKHLEANGYSRIDLPMMEYRDLYEKGIGETSEIVEKQMFIIPSKKEGRDLVLRPEGTAGVVRAYLEHGMQALPQPVLLYYIGPMFRKESPQQDRWRQHYQFGVEAIGTDKMSSDAQVIKVIWDILNDLGFQKLTVKINTIGCERCRPEILEKLADFYQSRQSELCPACKKRLKKNPLRILDCKERQCQKVNKEAPKIIDLTCEDCQKDFRELLEFLDDLGIKYDFDNSLVRGLDYYTKTVFEITYGKYQNSLAGGGRYDGLVKLYGGRPTGAVGWGAGMDRIVTMMKKENLSIPNRERVIVFLAQLGKKAKKESFKIMDRLQEENIPVRTALAKDSLRDQLKMADRAKARITLILGEKELQEGNIILRDMKEGIQDIVPKDKIISILKKKLKL